MILQKFLHMKNISTLVLLLFTIGLLAQNSANRDIPEIVEKNFSKKFPRAENISWDKVDSSYKVDCFFRGAGTYAEFTPEGVWVQTVVDQDRKKIYPPIQRYIDENYGKDKVVLVEKATRADRNNYYYVQIERKMKGSKQHAVFELFFDKTGKIERVEMPAGFEELTVVGIDDHNAEIPAEVIEGWQKRFPRAEDIEWSKEPHPSDTIDFKYFADFAYRDMVTKAEFLPNGKWVESRVKYKEKDLYKPVLAYIEQNHWDDNLIIAEKVTRKDRKDYYYVKLERNVKGQFRPFIFELYFDKSGKITKVIRPEELRNQYLLTVDIPKAVAKKFKSRFSSAQDVTWETDNGNWVADFYYRGKTTAAIFSDSAKWIQTLEVLDPKNIYAPVQRTLDKEYSGYKVVYAEKATRKDRKDYYYIELTAKKKKMQPNQLVLYFDKTGRLKEDK